MKRVWSQFCVAFALTLRTAEVVLLTKVPIPRYLLLRCRLLGPVVLAVP